MKFIIRLLAVIGALAVLFVLFLTIAAASRGKAHIPMNAVLELNLETGMVEDVPNDPFARLGAAKTPLVRDVVDALERAGDDHRVRGLVAHFGTSEIGFAQVQEIRDAILSFRKKNKFAYAWSESYGGDWGQGTGPYYLASAFDQIFVQSSGDVQITGVMLESPFLKGTLGKLGMPFHGDHRYEYKSALDTFTQSKYTPANKEELEAVMNSWYGQIVRGVAEARSLKEDDVRALIDRAPLSAQEAVDAKLVDAMKYRDEVYDLAKKKAGNRAEMIFADRYLESAGRRNDHGKTIALVYGVGQVTRGKSGYDPVFGGASMGSDTVAGALRAASDNKDVRAILFRVDSPGGSYVASDAIWREVVRAKEKHKPVIVSMGDLAGSGGYFVAMAADKIVAQPGTITASIGVLGGKFLTSGLWNQLGLSWDEVHAGANATLYTGTEDYTPAEWQKFENWLDRVYDDFTTKVAAGRRLPKNKVLEIAKGRIWSGEDAKNLGLVDELGGFPVALKLAKQAAGIPESEEVNLKIFPAKKSALEALLSGEPDNSDKEYEAGLTRIMETIQPIARQMRMLNGYNRGVLTLPQFREAKPIGE